MLEQNDLDIVNEFLIRFYHQEPDYFKATIRALEVLSSYPKYKWELAKAFQKVLEFSFPEDTLKNCALLSANRFVQNDDEAKAILTQIYDDNILYTAIDFDDLQD